MNLIFYFFIISVFYLTVYSQVPYTYPGFPIIPDTTKETIYSLSGSPLIADIDNNGIKEIIYVNYKYPNIGYALNVINEQGYNLPGFPKILNYFPFGTACGDVNNDGNLDIVIKTAGTIEAIDKSGNSLPGFPVSYANGNHNTSNITLFDLDNDNMLEIISSRNGDISVFNYNGVIRNGWPRSIGEMSITPAVGDIDNDGYGEIIVLNNYEYLNTDSCFINIFRHNGITYSINFPFLIDSAYQSNYSCPTLYINGNHIDSSFFCFSVNKQIYQFTNLNKLIKLDLNGTIKNMNWIVTDYTTIGSLVMSDINNDNRIEFLCGGDLGETLYLLDNDLNIKNNWPKYGSAVGYGTPLIGKLSSGSQLQILSFSSDIGWTFGYGYIFAYDINGNQLDWSPVRPWSQIKGISVNDINNDGNIEIIATGSQSHLGFIYMWTLPGISYNTSNFPWPMFAHDRYRTNQYGFIPPDEPIGIKLFNNEIPDELELFQNYPNPFNPVTTIKFAVPVKGNLKLDVYDITGRLIYNLLNMNLDAGTYKYQFNAADLASGIYFYVLSSQKFLQSRKMILIK